MARKKLTASELRKRKRAGAYHDGRQPLSAKKIAKLKGRRQISRCDGARPLSAGHQDQNRHREIVAAALRDERPPRTQYGLREFVDLPACAGERACPRGSQTHRRWHRPDRCETPAPRRRQGRRRQAADVPPSRGAIFQAHQAEWTSASHRDQFLASLRNYAFPALGDLDVAAIETTDVLRAVQPIWMIKTVDRRSVCANASSNILDFAVVSGHRPPGTNPARGRAISIRCWPARQSGAGRALRAIAYANCRASWPSCASAKELAARALEFLVLTAARTSEAIGATWDEIDFANATWVVPPLA